MWPLPVSDSAGLLTSTGRRAPKLAALMDTADTDPRAYMTLPLQPAPRRKRENHAPFSLS